MAIEDAGDAVRVRARELAAEAVAAGDGTGWFEKLYASGLDYVPWADGIVNPHLASWASARAGAGQSALVVGCGLGYDAEFLAGLGYAVTAFDIAPTAISAARSANPGSAVTYAVADLLALPAPWIGAFDLVVEIYTVQPLYGAARSAAIAAVHRPVAPGGTLLVIARATGDPSPRRDPAQMPWPLTRAELDACGGPLTAVRVEQFMDAEEPPKLRWRAEFRRDAAEGSAPSGAPTGAPTT